MASHCLCSAYQLILKNAFGGLSVYMPGPHLGDSDAMALLLSQGSCIIVAQECLLHSKCYKITCYQTECL